MRSVRYIKKLTRLIRIFFIDRRWNVFLFLPALDKPSLSLKRGHLPIHSVVHRENYTRFEFPGDAHGMMLISPAIEPNPLELILGFMAQVLG